MSRLVTPADRCSSGAGGKCWKDLTEQEQEMLELLAKRLDNSTIADTLDVPRLTVEYHVTSILSKLGGGCDQRHRHLRRGTSIHLRPVSPQQVGGCLR
jgi:DNA-binding NarL/FixJ family response regulator